MAEKTSILAQTSIRRWMIILIVAAVAFYWASLYFYVPTLPVYVQSKTNDLATVGVVLSMYGLWQGILRFPLGITADWIGRRKPFIIFGFLMCALGAWVMATASGTGGLIAGRAITGLAAATWVPLTVLFSTLFPPEEAIRATALLSLSNTISRMVATGMTGTLNEVGGYRLAFYFAIAAAGLAILVTIPVHEQARPPKKPSGRRIFTLVTSREVLLPALLSIVCMWIAWSSTFGFLPVLAKNLGANDQLQSVLMSMNLGVGLIGNLVITALARRGSNRRLVYVSFAIICTGIILAGLGNSLTWVFIGQALLGLGDGISGPLLMGMCIKKIVDSERTTAMGLYQAVYAIGMFAGPWVSGILAKAMGIPPMFMITGVVALFIGLAGTRALRE